MHGLDYLLNFVVGGLSFSIFKYLAGINMKLCCLLPVIPIFFPVSIYLFHYNNKEKINRYLSGSIYAVSLYLLFLMITYFIYSQSNNIYNSMLISFLFYSIFLFIFWNRI